MKSFLSVQPLMIFILGGAAAAAPGVVTTTMTLPPGTKIPVRLAQALDTKRDNPGSPFVAHVASPLIHNGDVVLQRGATCRGHLVQSKPSGRLRGRAAMQLSLDSCESHGKNYTLATSWPVFRSKDHKKRNLAIIGGSGGGGATLGAIAGGGAGALIGAGAGAAAGTAGALITGRRNLYLPAETRVNFVLARPLTVHAPAQSAQNR